MRKEIIYIGNPWPESYGSTIIVDKLVEVFKNNGQKSEAIFKICEKPKDSFIIPYGIDMALEMIDNGYITDTVFLADAFTLGYIEKIKFYLKHLNIFHYDFFYCFYCLLRDYRLETKVVRNFKNIILVSETDINFLKKRAHPETTFYCMPNGANFCHVEPKTKSDIVRLGILSNWWHTTLAEENAWFINDYFQKYAKTHKNVKLYLAGRGSYIEQFRKIPGVEIMGEVGDLNDFFKNIDIFITANPKGCGILNRVLDAFAYKTCVLGNKNSFTGFRYMKDSFVEFDDYRSFVSSLNELSNNIERREQLVQNAYAEITEHNDWEKNIIKLLSFIQKKNV